MVVGWELPLQFSKDFLFGGISPCYFILSYSSLLNKVLMPISEMEILSKPHLLKHIWYGQKCSPQNLAFLRFRWKFKIFFWGGGIPPILPAKYPWIIPVMVHSWLPKLCVSQFWGTLILCGHDAHNISKSSLIISGF